MPVAHDIAWLTDALEAKVGEFLYHGGPGGDRELNDATLASFRERGIVGSTVYRTEATTYLTSDPDRAFLYATANGRRHPGPVFRIRVRDLDPECFRGDEWHLLPDPRYPDWDEATQDMSFPADGFDDPDDVLASLDDCAQIAYVGTIPAHALELVAGHGFAG